MLNEFNLIKKQIDSLRNFSVYHKLIKQDLSKEALSKLKNKKTK